MQYTNIESLAAYRPPVFMCPVSSGDVLLVSFHALAPRRCHVSASRHVSAWRLGVASRRHVSASRLRVAAPGVASRRGVSAWRLGVTSRRHASASRVGAARRRGVLAWRLGVACRRGVSASCHVSASRLGVASRHGVLAWRLGMASRRRASVWRLGVANDGTKLRHATTPRITSSQLRLPRLSRHGAVAPPIISGKVPIYRRQAPGGQ